MNLLELQAKVDELVTQGHGLAQAVVIDPIPPIGEMQRRQREQNPYTTIETISPVRTPDMSTPTSIVFLR